MLHGMDAVEIGRRIRAGRERRRWTQEQLAEAVDVKSVRTIGSWERGETVPQNRLATLEQVLEIELTDYDRVERIEMDDGSVVMIPTKGRLSDEDRLVAEASARAAWEAAVAALQSRQTRTDR